MRAGGLACPFARTAAEQAVRGEVPGRAHTRPCPSRLVRWRVDRALLHLGRSASRCPCSTWPTMMARKRRRTRRTACRLTRPAARAQQLACCRGSAVASHDLRAPQLRETSYSAPALRRRARSHAQATQLEHSTCLPSSSARQMEQPAQKAAQAVPRGVVRIAAARRSAHGLPTCCRRAGGLLRPPSVAGHHRPQAMTWTSSPSRQSL